MKDTAQPPTGPARRRPHLLRVEGEATAYAGLFAALQEAGLRLGWLDFAPALAPAPAPALPAGLEAAAAAGALRAVAVAGGRSVAVKPMRGPAVLRDLLREHFRGCTLVLVVGEPGEPREDCPRLAPPAPGSDLWRLDPPGEAARTLSVSELVAALRRPRPWS